MNKDSTQNKVFNDLPEKDQKDIIRGAMKHAKKMQDEVLEPTYQGYKTGKEGGLIFETSDLSLFYAIKKFLGIK